jgi:GTP cyclohydrolase I
MKDHLIIGGIKMLLQGLEVNVNDSDYIKTPHRVLEYYKEMFNHKPAFPPVYEETYSELIVARHHQAWTICPHHLLPVRLDISLGYIPRGGVVGLSKLMRIADHCLNAPIKQETLTDDIANAVMGRIKPSPIGAGVIIKGEHACMQMRGVRTSANVVTSAMRGAMFDKPEARSEFLQLVNGH